MRVLVEGLAQIFDVQTCIILVGLVLLGVGLGLVFLPAALIVPGGLLFLMGVGWFMPKGKT